MSKSSLIIDTPEYCYLCSCYVEYGGEGYCQGITVKRVPTEGKPSWCPLKPYKKVDVIPIWWIDSYCTDCDIGLRNNNYKAIKKLLEDWEKENADL